MHIHICQIKKIAYILLLINKKNYCISCCEISCVVVVVVVAFGCE